jgi:hypothetical protein
MKLTTKLFAASILTFGALSAQAGQTPSFVYGGTMFDEPARAVTPRQAGATPSYVYGGENRAVVTTDTAQRESVMPAMSDSKARARAYVG